MSKSNFVKKKGFSLVIVLGVITVFSMMGTAFVLNNLYDRKQAINYENFAKAKYLAEAGLARAISELKYGEDGACSNAIDTLSERWAAGYEGEVDMGGDIAEYYVSVVDCASQIYINDDKNPNLAQILKNLIAVLGDESGGMTDGDCDTIIANRPAEGFYDKEMLKFIISQEKYNAIAPYITVHAYVDTKVVDPLDITTPYAFQPRAPINVNTASREVIQAVLMGLKANNACPYCGGDGFWWGHTRGYSDGKGDCPYCDGIATLSSPTGHLEITPSEAALIANRIVEVRPFKSMSEFFTAIRNYCNSLAYSPVTGKSGDADLVMANANPNTAFSWCKNEGWGTKLGYIGKYNIPWEGVNLGLATYTTEFCLNSGGYYEITSTGTIKASTSAKETKRTLKVIVKLFDIYKETTQSQFANGSLSNLVTYPQNREAGISSSEFDGQIMLSRMSYGVPDGSATPYFRANYLDKVNGDAGSGTTGVFPPPLIGATSPTTGSLVNFSNRGDLMPDGMLIDYYNNDCAYYLPFGNLSEAEGTMEIWFKPRWNSYDSMGYGSEDRDKKFFRFTSGSRIEEAVNDLGPTTCWPYATFFFWSDFDYLWAQVNYGGGCYKPADAQHTDPYWYFYGPMGNQYGYFDRWSAGKWNHLVVTWKNPEDPLNPLLYNSADNPFLIYLNGKKKFTQIWYYHTPYANEDPKTMMGIGAEYDTWNGRQLELSDSVIGTARIWPRMLTDNEIQAEYEAGFYRTSGNFTSATFYPGKNVEWGAITWTEAIPRGSSGNISFSVDAGGGWTGDYDSPGGINPINGSSSSIRYSANFTAGAAGVPEVEEDMDVLINGGFEREGGEAEPLPPPWSNSPTQPFEATTDNPHSGFRSARNAQDRAISSQSFYITPGGKYKLVGWTYVQSQYADSSDKARIIFNFVGPSGSGGGASREVQNVVDEWAQWDLGWVTAPSWANHAYARIEVGFVNGERKCDFDDLAVIEQGGVVNSPLLDSPVLEDVTITYLPETQIIEQKWD